MRPYEVLANAIIEQAAVDYRIALKYKDKHPDKDKYAYEAARIERFFRSPWFEMLTTVDGEFLMTKIQAMVRKEVVA